jgi:hypothetical protein
LREPEHGARDDDAGDDDAVCHVADRDCNHGGHHENQRHGRHELPAEQPQPRFRMPLPRRRRTTTSAQPGFELD